MKKSVYPSDEARPFHNAFVWAYLDADDRANQPVMSQFKVSGIPHVAFVSPDGRIMGHFTGAIAPKEFAGVLTQVLADAGKPAAGSGTKAAAPQGSGAKQGSSTKR
jgi:thioredoxin-like negative regulator of GroEL